MQQISEERGCDMLPPRAVRTGRADSCCPRGNPERCLTYRERAVRNDCEDALGSSALTDAAGVLENR